MASSTYIIYNKNGLININIIYGMKWFQAYTNAYTESKFWHSPNGSKHIQMHIQSSKHIQMVPSIHKCIYKVPSIYKWFQAYTNAYTKFQADTKFQAYTTLWTDYKTTKSLNCCFKKSIL